MFAAALHLFKELPLFRPRRGGVVWDCKSRTFTNTDNDYREKNLLFLSVLIYTRLHVHLDENHTQNDAFYSFLPKTAEGFWKVFEIFVRFLEENGGGYSFTYFSPHR